MAIHKQYATLLGLLLASAVRGAPLTDAAPVVDLGYATYQGALNTSTNITTFIGVRYAAPPTGALRFQAPHPPAHVAGVQIANTQSAECIQGDTGASLSEPFKKRVTTDEDCLFLNVFIPGPLVSNAKLPVVVWIHGGGYAAGSTNGVDGGDLIRDAEGGVIAVTIQYRLGAFGKLFLAQYLWFLAGTEVKEHGVLNAGLLDQNFAFEWVQKHITSFGGDPTKVTIWGQSAGAGSVLQHVVAHGGNTQPSLFRGAMTSSTFLPSQYHFADPVPEKIYADVLSQTNCSLASNTFECLQSIDASVLGAANTNISLSGFFGTFVFVPVVDGTFIVERPIQTITKGRVNGDVLFSVTNTFEGRDFVSASTTTATLADYVTELFPNFSKAQVNAVVNAYTNVGLPTTLDQAIGVMGESIFICPTHILLGAFPSRSHKAEFAIPPGNHGDDVPYYFPGTPDFNNTAFITSFSQSFLAVVKSQDPNATPDPINITPQWNVYSDDHTEMLFNETTAGLPDIRPITTDAGLLERCSLWQSLSASTPQ